MIKPYYEQSGVTIYHGDCREVLPTLRADVVVTDPPYGLSGSSGTINTARAKAIYGVTWADTEEAVKVVFSPAVSTALDICGGRGVITPGTPHAFEYPKPTDIAALFQPASPGMSKWGRATWQPVLFYGRDPRAGLTIQPMTFQSNGVFYKCAHPCSKPEDVAIWMVTRATLVGETILDPFAGSGTFLWAAKRNGRKAIGIEIEERYCEIAAKRLQQEALPLSMDEPARLDAVDPVGGIGTERARSHERIS